MPAGRSGPSWSNLFLLLTLTAALQQLPQDESRPAWPRVPSSEDSTIQAAQPTTVKHGAHRSPTPRIDVSYGQFRDTHAALESGYIDSKNNNERAVATLAPTAKGVRRPSQQIFTARSAAGPTDGLNVPSVRNLQDWEAEDLVLLATVDGQLHARDRKTGTRAKWVFKPKDRRPIVETIYHSSDNGTGAVTQSTPDDGLFWIVEPSQDGALYIFNNSGTGNKGIQKLGLTVKSLVDATPFDAEEFGIRYESKIEKKVFKISALTGREAKGQRSKIEQDCKISDTFSVQECASQSFLEIGRLDYTVTITNTTTEQLRCTIRYSEWIPSGKNRDLQSQYRATKDGLYVHSFHDGRFYNVDSSKGVDIEAIEPKSRNRLPVPLVQVLDVARNNDPEAQDVPLAVLPQPASGINTLEYMPDSVFVNATSDGSFFALSEQQYPFVTAFAKIANCYNRAVEGAADISTSSRLRDLVGIHYLNDYDPAGQYQVPTLPGTEIQINTEPYESVLIDGGNVTPSLLDNKPARNWPLTETTLYALAVMLLTFVCSYAGREALQKLPQFAKPQQQTFEGIKKPNGIEQVLQPVAEAKIHDPAQPKEVRFAEPESSQEVFVEPTTPGMVAQAQVRVDSPDLLVLDEAETPKKKTHRGQRGGQRRNKQKRKDSEAKETMTEQLGRQLDTDHTMQPDAGQMTGSMSDVSSIVRLNNLEILKDSPLGYGSGGTVVFEGTFEGREVAVKQMMPQYYELVDQEVNMLRDSDDHPNVIRYYCTQKDVNFHYIALERCQASLFDLYKDGGNRDALTDEQKPLVDQINLNVPGALQQLAAGLAHLHQLRIIHRDIKPQNILITYPRKGQRPNVPRFVISDFGLCKTLPENMSTLMGTTGNAGTIGWKAPELITNPRMSDNGQSSQGNKQESTSSNDGGPTGVKRAIDIFSLGCVFFYVLTNGCHPFDADKNDIGTIMREINIKRNIMNLRPLNVLGDGAEEPMHLIGWMLAPNPADRPTAQIVLKHPFFWSDAMRLAFLCDVSDHFERECRDPPSADLLSLEAHSANVIRNGDFLAKLDYKFIVTLGKQRKYSGNRMLDLLRALRNKKNHYADMPDDVKYTVGSLPSGYLKYWTSRFPDLVIACYEVVRECRLERDPRFWEYMGTDS